MASGGLFTWCPERTAVEEPAGDGPLGVKKANMELCLNGLTS